ncbi:MAG: peptidoglycan-binding protein [Chthoniobacterales bacterium]
MRTTVLLLAIFCAATFAQAQSDSVIASTQQALKDQGFYFGEITGKKDADTTAALRRYQIRNGLQVTGELNAETQKSLGVKGTIAPPAVPRVTPPPPPPHVKSTPPPENSDFRDDAPVRPNQSRPNEDTYDGAAPENIGGNLFAGTPYQNAPPEMQRRVIMNAQSLLARRGYYRSIIDGEFGPDTEFALRAFQSRFNLPSSGRLDRPTLATLGLLPGQRAPGVSPDVAVPHYRVYRRAPQGVTPDGEPVYQGR